jgi:hypothetical protein
MIYAVAHLKVQFVGGQQGKMYMFKMSETQPPLMKPRLDPNMDSVKGTETAKDPNKGYIAPFIGVSF